MIYSKKQQGFSLIELLVVIAIIILLAGISIIALNNQQAKARDATRISDIRQIRTALEFYYSDEGEYPIALEAIALGSNDKAKLCGKKEGGFVSVATDCKAETTYMAKVASDPFSDKKFLYSGSDNGYDVVFTTEKDSSLGKAGAYHAHSDTIDTVVGNK